MSSFAILVSRCDMGNRWNGPVVGSRTSLPQLDKKTFSEEAEGKDTMSGVSRSNKVIPVSHILTKEPLNKFKGPVGPGVAGLIDWDNIARQAQGGEDVDHQGASGEDIGHQAHGGEAVDIQGSGEEYVGNQGVGVEDGDKYGPDNAPLKIFICPSCGLPFSDLAMFTAHREEEHEVMEELEVVEQYSCSTRGTVSSSGSFYTALEVTQEE